VSEKLLRARMVAVGGRLAERGYIHGRAGNLSARLPDGNLLATPAGLNKAEIYADQLLVVDLEGRPVRARAGLRPTTELPMHLEVYRQRPDVGAVIHAHPINCIVLSLLGISMEDPYLPEALVLLGPVPTTPYATPSSAENRAAIAGVIAGHDALILSHHGSLTVGRDLDEALERLEVLEHSAAILVRAHQIGQPQRIPAEELGKLEAMRRQMKAAGQGEGQEDELQQRIAGEVARILRRQAGSLS
jgi:L-fuculose-phosphate aldolase